MDQRKRSHPWKKRWNLCLVGGFILCCTGPLQAQTGSEIFLIDLRKRAGQPILGTPQNVTQRAGYDNQPSFHPREPLVYYASFDDRGRADIKQYHWRKRATQALTQTPEREYSPTVTPDGQFLSCIIQRDNGAQDLGQYPLKGGQPMILVDNLTVGYHAWASQEALLLFVLGEPVTLRWYDVITRKDTVLATSIGRSLHKIPGQAAISFVHKESATRWVVKRLDLATRHVSDWAETLPGREDMAWLPDGTLLSSDGNQLFWYDAGKAQWRAIATPASLKGITRLAVSPDGKKLAVVVAE